MKNIIKLTFIALTIILVLSLFSCDVVDGIIDGGNSYTISNILMTQTGIDSFNIEFSANSGVDDVKIYFTRTFRLKGNETPIEVSKKADGLNNRYSFDRTLALGENYYLWVVCGEKQGMIGITAPSMFPGISKGENGESIFNFKYTYGTAWDAFCDPEGKALYVSSSPVFDSTAELIKDGIAITDETCVIPADKLDQSKYYYSVSTAKDGVLRIISRPVMIPEVIISQVEDISASITNDFCLRVDFEIADGSAIDKANAEYLQLLVKTDTADDVIVANCTYANGVATMLVGYNKLAWSGVWYDVCLAWQGAVVADIPQYYNNKQTNQSSTVKNDEIIYGIASWKAEDAPEHSEALKMYFEKDTTRYAEEFCKSYLVTFTTDPAPAVMVTLKLKDNVKAPVLAITAGDKTKIAETQGVLNDDGSYSFTLSVDKALTEADKWYDLRLFFDNIACEMLKDSCITYSDFAAKYTCASDSRVYEFREYNGMLKLMYTASAK